MIVALPLSRKFLYVVFLPAHPLWQLNARSPAQPVTPPWAQPRPQDAHTLLTALFNSASQREIPPGPLVRRLQMCSLPISHHAFPTGSDLARTRVVLGIMNHHFIFLSHMWVKLFDRNHTPAAPVWNRRAICPPPVAGCSLCLHPECLF